MNKLKCTLYVNSAEIENRILEYIQNFDTIEVLAVFKNELEMIEKLTHLRPDVLFLDICGANSAVADFLQIMTKPPFIIGITQKMDTLKNYLDNGFFDLIRPEFSLTDFCRTISKIITIATSLKTESNEPAAAEPPVALKYKSKPQIPKEYIILRHHRDKTRVRYDDILYILNVGNVVKIIDVDGKPHYHASTLVKILKELPFERFARVNKSVIVNCDKIDKIANQKIYIRDTAFLLSRTYSIELMERFDRK